MNCVFCGSAGTEIRRIGTRQYCFCGSCSGVSVHPDCFISPEQQKQRYLLHKNTLADRGYVSFLSGFIDPVLERVGAVSSIADYGSGPSPCLVRLLEQYRDCGKLPAAVSIYGWDPFFLPEPLAEPAELVTCLEVAEHFERPAADFARLAAACRPGGFVAVGTLLWEQPPECFGAWWYKDDSTHVSFYSPEALRVCAAQAGLQLAERISARSFLFRKTENS